MTEKKAYEVTRKAYERQKKVRGREGWRRQGMGGGGGGGGGGITSP